MSYALSPFQGSPLSDTSLGLSALAAKPSHSATMLIPITWDPAIQHPALPVAQLSNRFLEGPLPF